jgi:hypothetical protein
MKFVSPLSGAEFQVLNDACMQGEKPTLRHRVHAILLSNKGYAINQISYKFLIANGSAAWEMGLRHLRYYIAAAEGLHSCARRSDCTGRRRRFRAPHATHL